MGWIDDAGLHEGYVVAEWSDGVRSSGTYAGDMDDDQVIVDDIWDDVTRTMSYVTRPAAEIVGWRLLCDCRSPYGDGNLPEERRWRSELLRRVPGEGGPRTNGEGTITAPDDDLHPMLWSDDVMDELSRIWWDQHIAPADRLDKLTDAVRAENAAREATNRLAREARDGGATWDQIGRAAGITRQSAQQRWGR
ncbi:MAG: hypothetical protein JSR82_23985 [Verrucomicrobia bacterium]|nr:hypothetical protein [Verrucomicrobiota bacterium]